ncbi:MAG: Eco57I restriction-modification methylase domain-containing protein, partial [Promethearchaeota archaeon]
TQIKKFSGENTFFDWKSDLYVYFSLMALSLLEDGGILAFLTSNAWLEVKYGRTLQKYILDPINRIYMFEIIHRSGRRLWDQLGINSVIFIGQKALSKNATIPKGTFTEFLVDFSQVPLSSLRNCIMFQNTYEDQYYRIELIQRDLLKQTHKWGGTFLRTSGSERVLLKRFKNRGLPLSLLADVRFGIKTGANDFFHIRCIEDKPRSDGKTYIKNRMGYEGLVENIYLVPLVKSPADIKGFVIPSSFTSNLYLFYCLDSPNELQGSEALKYIKWAEKVNVVVKQGKISGSKVQGFSSLQSVKQREYWYSIGEYPPPSLLWTKSYHDRPGCLYNQAKILPDQRLYGINVMKKEHLPLIFTYLNSSLVWAQMEAEGNTNMGFGVLDTNVYFLREIKIPIDAMEEKNQILRLMNELINQEERVSMLQFSPVRSEIDQFYAKYFNLSHNSMKRLYGYISRSIHNRIR